MLHPHGRESKVPGRGDCRRLSAATLSEMGLGPVQRPAFVALQESGGAATDNLGRGSEWLRRSVREREQRVGEVVGEAPVEWAARGKQAVPERREEQLD